MITVTIDGRQVRTEPGTTIIEAAFANGIHVPHFCWHPSLSVSGNCRLCLVEVEGNPKQVIACATACSDGMVVRVDSERAVRARAAVMEFILVNHPLDCPICDEAGECKLQDHAVRYGAGASRFDEEKNHKRKRAPLGPNVMFDAERCISCSRCIRFCAEVAGDPQLTFVERGDRVTIETFPGRALDNPYAMNVIELCPVGALTSVDFRFAARAWDMARVSGICTGCARGCNAYYWTRGNRILRMTPRENRAVNDVWLCDAGRLESWRQLRSGARPLRPRLRGAGAPARDASWDEALDAAAALLRGVPSDSVAVIGTPFGSCEDNAALVRLARETLGAGPPGVFPHALPGGGDAFLRCADGTPNMRGARLAGVAGPGDDAFERLLGALREGRIRAAIVADARLEEHPEALAALRAVPGLIVIADAATGLGDDAAVLLPAATAQEALGTMVNVDGRLQLSRPCLVTARPEPWHAGIPRGRLDAFGTEFDRWGRVERPDVRPVWQIAVQLAGRLGDGWSWARPEDVFDAMNDRLPAVRGITYDTLDGGVCVEGDDPAPRRRWDYHAVHP